MTRSAQRGRQALRDDYTLWHRGSVEAVIPPRTVHVPYPPSIFGMKNTSAPGGTNWK
jgi:hypothetical protein